MKLFKTFIIGDTKREYFVLNNNKALELGWKFAIEVKTTFNSTIVRNRYFCNTELGVHEGVNYWNKYE